MNVIFADTFFFVAAINPRDSAHVRAIAFSDQFQGRLVTTEWIVSELANALAAGRNRLAFAELLNPNSEVALRRARGKARRSAASTLLQPPHGARASRPQRPRPSRMRHTSHAPLARAAAAAHQIPTSEFGFKSPRPTPLRFSPTRGLLVARIPARRHARRREIGGRKNSAPLRRTRGENLCACPPDPPPPSSRRS